MKNILQYSIKDKELLVIKHDHATIPSWKEVMTQTEYIIDEKKGFHVFRNSRSELDGIIQETAHYFPTASYHLIIE